MGDEGERRAEYPSLGHEGLAVVLRAIQDGTRLAPRASSDEVLMAYSGLFERAFSQLSVMVGARGAQAIGQRAIKRASVRRPGLGAAAVSEERVALAPLREGAAGPEQLQDELQHLFLTTMDVLASLIGEDLIVALLDRTNSGHANGGAR